MTPSEIKALRERLGLKQREMAEGLKVTLRSYQRWEAGEREPGGPAVELLRRLETGGKKLRKNPR